MVRQCVYRNVVYEHVTCVHQVVYVVPIFFSFYHQSLHR